MGTLLDGHLANEAAYLRERNHEEQGLEIACLGETDNSPDLSFVKLADDPLLPSRLGTAEDPSAILLNERTMPITAQDLLAQQAVDFQRARAWWNGHVVARH
jgi:hypothetical protein